MTLLLPTLAVAFVALCVWLTVRVVNRRERWAKWMLSGIGFLLVYPLSFGPMVWLDNSSRLPWGSREAMHRAYCPLADIALDDAHPFAHGLRWWALLGCNKKTGIVTLWMLQSYVTIPDIAWSSE